MAVSVTKTPERPLRDYLGSPLPMGTSQQDSGGNLAFFSHHATCVRLELFDSPEELLADAPLLERIAEDPILTEVKLIAEAWDVAGAYQAGAFASHICGSADVYAPPNSTGGQQRPVSGQPRRLVRLDISEEQSNRGRGTGDIGDTKDRA